MDVASGEFGSAYDACKKHLDSEQRVPYYLRARLDEASRTVSPDGGGFSRGKFHFYFRILLSLRCAEESFFLWSRAVADSELKNFKNLIVRGLNNGLPDTEIGDFCDSMDSEIDRRIYEWDEQLIDTAAAAGLSCITALRTYLGQFSFDTTGVDEKALDVYFWDSAFHSSVAIAHGAEWQKTEKELNISARTAFWHWYVNKAVPSAFDDAYRKSFSSPSR